MTEAITSEDTLVPPTRRVLAQRIRGLEMPWNRVFSSTSGPAGAATALGPWHPQEFQAECVETIPDVGDMMTFVFRRTDGAPLAFRSGQYINIDFPVYGPHAEPVSRSYSLSSAPTEPWTFSVSIKREPHGLVSGWAHDYVRPGTIVDMLGPVGAFHLPDYDRRARFLLLGAGSGITPLMSMIRTIHSLPGQADVILLYHGADPDRFPFLDELRYLERDDFRIKVVCCLGDRTRPAEWDGKIGRISVSLIDEVVPDANGRQVYACGPLGYLETATECLQAVGVDDTSINIEYFTGDRATLAEYAEEVALAGEIATAAEEFYESQPTTIDLYGSEDAEEIVVAPTEAVDAKAVVPVAETAEVEVLVPEDTDAEVTTTSVSPLTTESVTPADTAAEVGTGSADTGTVDPAVFTTVGDGALTVSFVKSEINVKVDEDERILPAARAAGVRIGANCQEGMCGSCKVVKLFGEVEMNHQGGIRAREIEAGKFLPCCSTAKTDLVIDA